LEQINVDVCSMNLDVNIIGVGAGFTYSTDGPTHHGLQDTSVMCNLPNLAVYNVTDAANTIGLVDISYAMKGPKYFRIEKGVLPEFYKEDDDFSEGLKTIIENDSELVVLSTGYMTHICVKALEMLDPAAPVTLVDIFRLKPLNKEKIVNLCADKKAIVVEENLFAGGLGEKILALLKLNNHQLPCAIIAVDNDFHFHFGSREFLHEKTKLDPQSICERIKEFKLGKKI